MHSRRPVGRALDQILAELRRELAHLAAFSQLEEILRFLPNLLALSLTKLG
jgi:uncharacterized protein YicC (UPF0701 family)